MSVLLLGVFGVACSGATAPEIPQATGLATEPAEDETMESVPSYAPAVDASAPPPTPDASASPPTCAAEIEPNEENDEATPFAVCITGTLTTSKDKDHVRIGVPAGVEKMTVTTPATNEKADKVQFRISRVEPLGLPTPFTSTPMSMKVNPGTTYFFQLAFARGGGKSARPWELKVAFE